LNQDRAITSSFLPGAGPARVQTPRSFCFNDQPIFMLW